MVTKERSAWDLSQINKYINQRNNNLKLNQSKMLDSILERKPQKITLDRLKYTNNSNQIAFTNDVEEIETIANQYYQNIGTESSFPERFSNHHSLPAPWDEIYSPKFDISLSASSQLEQPITSEEFYNTLRTLPNNKAPGISGISYDIIKKLSPDFFSHLVALYNYILSNQVTPASWNEAFLYPIPKSIWWDNNIKDTRPIVLLDTFRKLLAKIINTRLNFYLSNNSILQSNNLAGVQGTSCMEIIFNLQAAITATKTLKKPLYIMIQDLSKAYDRVDIPLLVKALHRICIPSTIINFIVNLFTDRQNSIIFEDWIGDSYTVLNGIDQGESICPLLWTIYYDPIFEAINKSQYEGINYQATLPARSLITDSSDIYSVNLTLKVQGYLDDTTWITSDLNNLIANLRIADQFYKLANIKINKDKTILLSNVKTFHRDLTFKDRSSSERYCYLQFGDVQTAIKVQPINKDTRILGVYLAANGDNKTTINKILSMVQYTTFLINKKRLTHDHVIYVINKDVIPRIEYLSQHTFLSSSFCSKLNSILRSTFKHSAGLPRSIFNSVSHSLIYPHIVNIFDHQIKCQAALVMAQAHSPTTSNTFKFLMLLTQFKFNLPDSPFDFFSLFEHPLSHFTRLECLFTFLKYYNITVDVNFQFKVRNGQYPISHYVIHPSFLMKHINSLSRKGIFFLDQIITLDSAYLLPYKDIKKDLLNKSGRTPHWYTFLQTHLTLGPSGHLNINLQQPVVQNLKVSRPRVLLYPLTS